MKNFKQKIINTVVVFIIAFIFSSCSSEPGSILGSWQEHDDITDQYTIMTFDKNNYLYIDNNGEVIGGKEFSVVENGVETFMKLTYEVDYSKDPHWLDLLMHIYDVKPEDPTYEFSSEEIKIVEDLLKSLEDGLLAKGIFEFTDEGKLKVQINTDAWNFQDNSLAIRPETFDPNLYSIMEKK